MINETFSDLLRDPAHWEFELLVGFIEMIIFDFLILGVAWKHIKHHLDRDKRDKRELLPQQDTCETENARALRTLFCGVAPFKDLPPGAIGWKMYSGPHGARSYGGKLTESLAQSVAGSPESGFCPFCQNPLVVNDANYEHCEICGATRIHDEWIEADKSTEVKS